MKMKISLLMSSSLIFGVFENTTVMAMELAQQEVSPSAEENFNTLLNELEQSTPDGAEGEKRFSISYTGLKDTLDFINGIADKNYQPSDEVLKSFLISYIVAKRIMENPDRSLVPVPGQDKQFYVMEKGINDQNEPPKNKSEYEEELKNKYKYKEEPETSGTIKIRTQPYTKKTNVRYQERKLSGIQMKLIAPGQYAVDKTVQVSIDDIMKAFRIYNHRLKNTSFVAEISKEANITPENINQRLTEHLAKNLRVIENATPDGEKTDKRYPISFTGIQKAKKIIEQLNANTTDYPTDDILNSFLTCYVIANRIKNAPSSLKQDAGSNLQTIYEKNKNNQYDIKTNVKYNKDTNEISGVQLKAVKNNAGKTDWVVDKVEQLSLDDIINAYKKLENAKSNIIYSNVGKLFFQQNFAGNEQESILFVKALDKDGNEVIYTTNDPQSPNKDEITKEMQEKLKLNLNMPIKETDIKAIIDSLNKPITKSNIERILGSYVSFDKTDETVNFKGKNYPIVKITKIFPRI